MTLNHLSELRAALARNLHDADFEIAFSPHLEALVEIAEAAGAVYDDSGYELSDSWERGEFPESYARLSAALHTLIHTQDHPEESR